jgi:hypothetical protein
VAGQWFFQGTSVSSTNKTDRHNDIAEILTLMVSKSPFSLDDASGHSHVTSNGVLSDLQSHDITVKHSK